MHHRDTEFAEIGVFVIKNSLLCALGGREKKSLKC
jgi:hypothetical protein